MTKFFYAVCAIVVIALIICSIVADVELWRSDLPFWVKFKYW